MEIRKKKRSRPLRYLIGTLIGATVGFLASQVSANIGSECTLLCQPEVAMTYFGLVGFALSLK